MDSEQRRHDYLQAMGISSWLPRTALPAAKASPDWVNTFLYGDYGSEGFDDLDDVGGHEKGRPGEPGRPRLTQRHSTISDVGIPETRHAAFGSIARAKGFLQVASTPLTRSSYHAGDDFAVMKAAREEKLARASRNAGTAAVARAGT